MAIDVVDLRDFYDTTLGRVARRNIMKMVLKLWPDVKGQVVLGLGFSTPYLKPFLKQARQVMAVMPADVGVIAWPERGSNRTLLAALEELPLEAKSVDRLLIVHGLEHASSIKGMLKEAWRVLKPNGKVLIIVPNRTSLWSQSSSTPFGYGHPFTLSQLSGVLKDNLFSCTHTARGLYIPPTRSRLILSTNPFFETLGPYVASQFSGVIAIEAIKQVFATHSIKAPTISLIDMVGARTT